MAKTTYHLVALFDYWSWDTCADMEDAQFKGNDGDVKPDQCRAVLCGSSQLPWAPSGIEEALATAGGHLNKFYDGCRFRLRAHAVFDAAGASWYALAGRDERKFVERHRVGQAIAPLIAIHDSIASATAALPHAAFTMREVDRLAEMKGPGHSNGLQARVDMMDREDINAVQPTT